jgi:hypothetical protein
VGYQTTGPELSGAVHVLGIGERVVFVPVHEPLMDDAASKGGRVDDRLRDGVKAEALADFVLGLVDRGALSMGGRQGCGRGSRPSS